MGTRYIKYAEIDKQKWDDCINRSLNGLIYAKTFYLDAMAQNWDGIVLNDYEAVMPLTWKRKWGIAYLYQPAFIQQGGIFSSSEITPNITAGFLDMAFSHFKFAEITLNYGQEPPAIPGVSVQLRNNYVLSLNSSYAELYSRYDSIAVKNIKRAKNAGLLYAAGKDYLPTLEMYENLYAGRLRFFSKSDFKNFTSVCRKLSEDADLIIRNVSSNKNELLAAAVLLKDKRRLYNLVSAVSPAGKMAQANYFLYDQLIREFSESNYILDFEGSDVEGIATFYQRFSPENEPYPFVKMNNLHPILKLWKR